MKKFLLSMFPVIDILMMPIVYPAAWLLKIIRRVGMQRLPLCKNALMNVGVFPIRNHYYEPQFDNRYPKVDFTQDRYLPGISWNIPEQLETLDRFTFSLELADIPQWRLNSNEYHFNNGSFESGDAEYWYSLIRAIKPKRIIEIGSGYSTLIAIKAGSSGFEG